MTVSSDPKHATHELGYSSGGLRRETGWWGAFVIGLAGTILVTGIAPVMVTSLGASVNSNHRFHHAYRLAALPLPRRARSDDAGAHRRIAELRLSGL